jgi:hypothetical protein
MNKRRVMVALCVMVLATSAIAMNSSARSALSSLGRRTGVLNEGSTEQRQKAARDNTSPQPAAAQGQPGGEAQPQAADIPKHVIYGMLFRERALFKKKAQEQESKGANGAFFREFHKNKLKLDDSETSALDRVADAANREVTKLDKKARKLIEDERAKHPGGVLKEGEVLPPPPTELTELENLRTSVLLQAREQLRAALGDAEFQRLEALLLEDAAKRMKVILRGGPAASSNALPGAQPLPPAGGTSTKG